MAFANSQSIYSSLKHIYTPD